VPQCEEDGSYSPMQCWASTGYCWCVDDNGVEIPGTSIQSWLGTPDCLGSTDSCEAEYIEGCMWFEFWEPVCGCDGISYSNQGEAGCYGIEDFIMGECASTILYGCTDSIACNFDVNANTDDNTCTYALLYYDCDGACINDIDEDGDCDEVDFDDEMGFPMPSSDDEWALLATEGVPIEDEEAFSGSIIITETHFTINDLEDITELEYQLVNEDTIEFAENNEDLDIESFTIVEVSESNLVLSTSITEGEDGFYIQINVTIYLSK